MSDETKPTVEEIRARLAAATPGPWNNDGNYERDRYVHAPGKRYLSKFTELHDATFVAHAPTDIAFLLERDAAREARVAELEAELATAERDLNGHFEDAERWRKETAEQSGRASKAEAELAGIRERARTAIDTFKQYIERRRGLPDDKSKAELLAFLGEITLIEGVVGMESEKGGGK